MDTSIFSSSGKLTLGTFLKRKHLQTIQQSSVSDFQAIPLLDTTEMKTKDRNAVNMAVQSKENISPAKPRRSQRSRVKNPNVAGLNATELSVLLETGNKKSVRNSEKGSSSKKANSKPKIAGGKTAKTSSKTNLTKTLSQSKISFCCSSNQDSSSEKGKEKLNSTKRTVHKPAGTVQGTGKSKDKTLNSTHNTSMDISLKLASEVPKEYQYLTTDETPENYWKELAEQRGAALDETLRENECLHDQLTVLKAENDQLAAVVNTVQELASFLVSNLSDDDDLPLSGELNSLISNSKLFSTSFRV